MDTARKIWLFRRYFDRVASKGETEELLDWIREQEDKDLIRLMDQAWENFNGRGIVFTEEQSEKMIASVLRKAAPVPNPDLSGDESAWKRRGRVIVVTAVMIAAVVVTAWALLSPQKRKAVPLAVSAPQNDVAPGTNKAVLSLAGGMVIVLDTAHDGIVARQGKTKVTKLEGGKLAFTPAVIPAPKKNGRSANPGCNILTTPRGGQYQLVLCDGSKVWLNAASSLKFPVAFDGRDRRVELKGEAYFKIAPDKQHPFSVTVAGFAGVPVTIRALGTRFNVKAYENEPAVMTTLLEGSVQVQHGAEEALLRPEQQAAIPSGTTEIQVTKAKIGDAVAWKNGFFHFDGDDLGIIMREIARWYNVTVKYEDGVPPAHFTGVISRDTNLSEVLKMLGLAGVHFRLQGTEIIVTS